MTKDSCQAKFAFWRPILEFNIMGLESVNVVKVDNETKQIETRAANNLFAFLFAILNLS
jgi:hypothetical protein